MDFVAELVLGFVDKAINSELKGKKDVRILRYRDDYRIFANDDERAEEALKIVSDKAEIGRDATRRRQDILISERGGGIGQA